MLLTRVSAEPIKLVSFGPAWTRLVSRMAFGAHSGTMWKRLALTLLWWNVCCCADEWTESDTGASPEKPDHWDRRGPIEVYFKLRDGPEPARRKVKPPGFLFTTVRPAGGAGKARDRCVFQLICEDPGCGELCELCDTSSSESHDSDNNSVSGSSRENTIEDTAKPKRRKTTTVAPGTHSSISESMVQMKDTGPDSDPNTWPYVMAKLVQTEIESAHMIIKQKPLATALLSLKESLKPVLIATSKTLSKIFATDAEELAKKAAEARATPATTTPVPVTTQPAVKADRRIRGRQRPRPAALRRAIKGKLIASRTQQPAGTEMEVLVNGCSCKCPALKPDGTGRHRPRMAARRHWGPDHRNKSV
uniref:Uncharacterized protein n=1 Tax=Anopheles atroparvus TaxID=41427 RepID=A0A182J7L9_ANOAO